MFEKVNPMHPDKIADRIAGALVDQAYCLEKNPRIAVEVLLGHGKCYILAETSVTLNKAEVKKTVERIVGEKVEVYYNEFKQDPILSNNQSEKIRCGDNGIFKGVPVTKEQRDLRDIANILYNIYEKDGKYIYDENKRKLIICQSNATERQIENFEDIFTRIYNHECKLVINPLGYWTGGINVDSGATNRKLGSDMGDSITGGGLHGKDLSKADVSVNIYAFLKAQETGKEVKLFCAIGDETIDGKPYEEIVEIARKYIKDVGGFEKFAEWGLI